MSILKTKQINSPLNITGSLYGTASWAENVVNTIIYVNENQNIHSIEVQDFDPNIAVTFDDGTGALKFIFGAPTPPAPTLVLSGFETNRFNKQEDAYNVIGTFNVGGYTLVSASLYTGSTLLQKVGSGTSINVPLTTSGSQYYKLEVTSSNPVDNSLNRQSVLASGILDKLTPQAPSIAPTANVQLGATSNLIEQGATGSIAFTSASGDARGWQLSYVSSSYTTPITVLGSLTGSSPIIITATAFYSSSGTNGADNDPALTTQVSSTFTYTKIRSVRYGAIATRPITQSEIENLAFWDTTLGGSVGKIEKGFYTQAQLDNKSITFDFVGPKYHYIIYDRTLGPLRRLDNEAGGNELGQGGQFENQLIQTTNYNMYISKDQLSSGGGSLSVTYTLRF
jgi:hypothetical protein